MRVVIVHNPRSGDETHVGARLVQLARREGHIAEYFPSNGPDWETAISGSTELVAVAGGDGTVADVAKRLYGWPVPIAVLPLGTANNIARALRSGDFLLVEVLNFGAAGPNLRLSNGSPSDGLLDVVLVEEHHRQALADHLSAPSGADPPTLPALPVFRAGHVKLACPQSRVHLDDEIWKPSSGAPSPVLHLSVLAWAVTMLARPGPHPRPRDARPGSDLDPPIGSRTTPKRAPWLA